MPHQACAGSNTGKTGHGEWGEGWRMQQEPVREARGTLPVQGLASYTQDLASDGVEWEAW